MTDQRRKHGELIAKAWSDPAFMARLKKDPRSAMKEVGIDLPANVNLEVIENTAAKSYLVIPSKPAGELSESDLDRVAGGDNWRWDSAVCW